VTGHGEDHGPNSGVPGGGLPQWSGQKTLGCHGDSGGCSVSLDFMLTKEGRERENSAAFCGWGGLVKETWGEVRCYVHMEERRRGQSACTQHGRGSDAGKDMNATEAVAGQETGDTRGGEVGCWADMGRRRIGRAKEQ
jgi:hypothetical protein